MDMLSGASVVERGIFDPRHANEAAIFAAWAASVAVIYWRLAAKHQSGKQPNRSCIQLQRPPFRSFLSKMALITAKLEVLSCLALFTVRLALHCNATVLH